MVEQNHNYDLDEKDMDVLRVAVSHDDATTTTMRENIEWITQTNQVRYRAERLDQLGLVNFEKVDGRWVVNSTQQGDVLVDNKPKPLDERVERLEAKLESVQKHLVANDAVLREYARLFESVGIDVDVDQIKANALDIDLDDRQ